MKNIIQVSENKVLKLTNVVIQEIDMHESENFGATVVQLENYIKSKGAIPIGPLIQKTEYTVNEEGQANIKIYLMRQANNFIHNVETPYKIESLIRIRNCMYAHYIGSEEKLKFAFDKINVMAFEKDIELYDENYVIFVNQQDDNIVADVFVEKKTNE